MSNSPVFVIQKYSEIFIFEIFSSNEFNFFPDAFLAVPDGNTSALGIDARRDYQTSL